MGSRVFTGFLVIFTAIILLFLPYTSGIYDFQTDIKEDSFTVITAVGTTNTTVSLNKPVYDSDTSTITAQSDLTTDIPLFSSYNSTTRATVFTGLSENATRTLTVSYDYDALNGSDAIDNVVTQLPWWYLLAIICFPLAAIAAMLWGRS